MPAPRSSCAAPRAKKPPLRKSQLALEKRRFDALRSRVARLDQAAARASTDVDAQLDDRRNMLSMGVGVVLSVAIVWTIIAAWLVRTWVSRPLAQLGRAVRAARAGDRDTKIPAPGPEEIAELGADVEAMRLQLVGALREAVRARGDRAERDGRFDAPLRARR